MLMDNGQRKCEDRARIRRIRKMFILGLIRNLPHSKSVSNIPYGASLMRPGREDNLSTDYLTYI